MTSPTSIEILPALREDIPLLRRVAIETQHDTFGEANTKENMEAFLEMTYSTEQLEKELKEEGSMYYLAWAGEELAGFMRLRVNDEAKSHLGDSAIELQRLYVTKKFQGYKIGKLLMERAIRHARETKFEWLWLGVWEHNVNAQEIYVKWGFTRFSDHTFWLGDDPQHDWLLKRRVETGL
jgi:ribosomal protein S18 acetylase RimI-like enzyme